MALVLNSCCSSFPEKETTYYSECSQAGRGVEPVQSIWKAMALVSASKILCKIEKRKRNILLLETSREKSPEKNPPKMKKFI